MKKLMMVFVVEKPWESEALSDMQEQSAMAVKALEALGFAVKKCESGVVREMTGEKSENDDD